MVLIWKYIRETVEPTRFSMYSTEDMGTILSEHFIPENICIRMMVETGLMFISGKTIIPLMPSGHWRKVLEAIIMSETEQPENILTMQMEAQH